MQLVKKPLGKQLIHDEANSSQNVSGVVSADELPDLMSADVRIVRQLEITEEEYKSKLAILEDVLKVKCLGKKFPTLKPASTDKNTNKIEFVLLTKDGAGLTVNLIAYGGGKKKRYYFGTRGSPTKLLSGQNLVELHEDKLIDKIMRKLSCSQFEARSLCGFWMFQSGVKDQFGIPFFNEEETLRIWNREVSVYSVGYASYENYGEKRDAIYDLLVNSCSYTVVVGGRQVKLSEFMNISSQTYATPSKRENRTSRLTGITMKRLSSGSPVFSQTIYLKGEEVDAKKDTYAGKGNDVQMNALSVEDKEALQDTHVRVDNVFYQRYLKQWVQAAFPKDKSHENIVDELMVDEDPEDSSRIMLKEIAPLFDDESNIKTMIGAMKNEIGLRTFLMAPTKRQISEMINGNRLCERTRHLLASWAAMKVTIGVDRVDGTHGLSWPSLKVKTPKDKAILYRLANEEHLDVSLPFEFYGFLSELKFAHKSTMEERVALSDEFIGFVDPNLSKAHLAPAARSRIEKKVESEIFYLRRTMSYVTVSTKKTHAKTFVLPNIKESVYD